MEAAIIVVGIFLFIVGAYLYDWYEKFKIKKRIAIENQVLSDVKREIDVEKLILDQKELLGNVSEALNRSIVNKKTDNKDLLTNFCPLCKSGRLVSRRSKYGPFFGCSNYPRCNYIKNINNNNEKALTQKDFLKKLNVIYK